MEFIIKIINLFIGQRFIYFRLSKNKIEMKDISSGQSISKVAIQKFSNDRLIIADFIVAEQFFRESLTELRDEKTKFFKRQLNVLIQIVDSEIKEITPVEARTYRDSVEHIGARCVWLTEKEGMLSDEEVLEIMK